MYFMSAAVRTVIPEDGVSQGGIGIVIGQTTAAGGLVVRDGAVGEGDIRIVIIDPAA